MNTKHSVATFALCLTIVVIGSSQLFAVPSSVAHVDVSQCDVLSMPTQVDEIGDFTIFPTGEELDAFDAGPANAVCLPTNNPSVLDLSVEIRNLTTKTFEQVWYVANPNTTISNYDGLANDLAFPVGHFTFRIDNMISDPNGSHHPLIGEFGGIADGKWQPGETWLFVLQDYFNAFGLAPSAIDSIGVGDASTLAGAITSSGSIVAIVPEPATCSLLLVSVAGALVRRRLIS